MYVTKYSIVLKPLTGNGLNCNQPVPDIGESQVAVWIIIVAMLYLALLDSMLYLQQLSNNNYIDLTVITHVCQVNTNDFRDVVRGGFAMFCQWKNTNGSTANTFPSPGLKENI